MDHYQADRLPHWRHPSEEIEHEDTEEAGEGVRALAALFETVFPTKLQQVTQESRRLWVESAFRRFTALAYLTRPDLFAMPQRYVAEALGISRARLSKLVVAASDRMGGLLAPGMKTKASRAAYASVPRGTTCPTHGPRVHIGEQRDDPALARHREEVIERARVAFDSGRNWTKSQLQHLRDAGLVSEQARLTSKGVAWIEEGHERAGEPRSAA